MKLISPDRTFIYFMYDRPDGRSQGIRFSRSMGAIGFTSLVPTDTASYPVPLEQFDPQPVFPPVTNEQMHPIMQNSLAGIDEEALRLLSGEISFDQALTSHGRATIR